MIHSAPPYLDVVSLSDDIELFPTLWKHKITLSHSSYPTSKHKLKKLLAIL